MKRNAFPDLVGGSASSAAALTALYEIVETLNTVGNRREAAGMVLDVFSDRLNMGKGVIGLVGDDGGGISVIALKGITEKEFLLNGKAFLRAAVAGCEEGEAFLAVDGLSGIEGGAAGTARFLSAAASLLSPLFYDDVHDRRREGGRRRETPLGRVLQKQISTWIAPMENTRRLRKSDVFDRLIGEVEKILIRAALEKTGYVQTEAARFLGINRNTLARKLRRYGLRDNGR